jgi:hypothetical protein
MKNLPADRTPPQNRASATAERGAVDDTPKDTSAGEGPLTALAVKIRTARMERRLRGVMETWLSRRTDVLRGVIAAQGPDRRFAPR